MYKIRAFKDNDELEKYLNNKTGNAIVSVWSTPKAVYLLEWIKDGEN